MRHRIQLAVLGLAIGAAFACSTPEKVIVTPALPDGGTRFINAVPDTAGAYGVDYRYVDLTESNAQFRMSFRNAPSSSAPFVATLTQYKETQEGSRHFRIFLSDTLQNVASVVLKDSSIAVVKGHNYTVMLWGNARSTGADKMALKAWEEIVPDPGTQIALRAVNTTNSTIEVRVYAQGGTAPAAADWTIPARTASTYITKAPGNYMYNVRDAATGTNLFADAVTIAGAVATVDLEAVAGSAVAGTALSAFIFPRSTAGARTPQTAAFAVPAIAFNWDRRPNRTCSPLC